MESLNDKHEAHKKVNKPSFDIIRTMTLVFQDIQSNGVNEKADIALGWMCPIFKKKDRMDISNYRPITILNTDYKILTKVLVLQLIDEMGKLIHDDQTGFVTKRSIHNNIRLATSIINYTEITETNGAIIALDQEKAYDRIRHDYLWTMLD